MLKSLQFVNIKTDAIVEEFEGTVPRIGEKVVFGPPDAEFDEDVELDRWLVVDIENNYYGLGNDRYEVATILVVNVG